MKAITNSNSVTKIYRQKRKYRKEKYKNINKKGIKKTKQEWILKQIKPLKAMKKKRRKKK